MSAIDTLLQSYRDQTTNPRDQGTAFEKLMAAWLVKDPVHSQRFERVRLYSDWAREQGIDRTDVGIDLVGTNSEGELAAIQCKFFAHDQSIDKRDIDSFMSASGKRQFSERVIIETTEKDWSDEAEAMLDDQPIPTSRIGLRDLRESHVDWATFAATGKIEAREPKSLRPDQQDALNAVLTGLREATRGKLIMACGTGKTLTGLRIAEEIAGADSHVLVMVPSLALMSQTVREWSADAVLPLKAFAVCSDTKVGKRRRSQNDIAEIEITDLSFPATTDAGKLARAVGKTESGCMRVVFATYQSIQVIADAQRKHGLPDFDFILCDEAHRTTGVTFHGEDESNFVKVHDNAVIGGRKRLYMTATPRIYGENAKTKAKDADAVLASMDDPNLYGELLHHYGFSTAVDKGILSDYRVIVLAMDEGQVSAAVQKRLSDGTSELKLDEATKIVGCWKALAKSGLDIERVEELGAMRRALAFCNSINNSKLVRDEFNEVISEFRASSRGTDLPPLECEVRHVDGTYNARERGKRLDWLKEDAGRDTCRILTNARCLTEGVDVPALDAILFLHPRKSQIDVVQAVGRVMRKAKGKHMGYVILPVGIPPDVPAEQALQDNEKYRVVWQILNALRAHDERLDAVINQGGLGQDVSDRITIVDGRSVELKNVTAVVEDLPAQAGRPSANVGEGSGGEGDTDPGTPVPQQLVIDEFSRAVMAKIVEKCGTREYWEDWAKDIAEIAEKHITRITSLVKAEGSEARDWFEDFLKELRDDLNESVTERDAIEMLAQHQITKPVFDALFEDHQFVRRNPISKAMTEVLSMIDQAEVSKEAESLAGFYASVRRRAEGVKDPQARQKLIVELYDKFFRGAFPLTTQKLGIVYTPVEIVDFIIHSVDEVLRSEFGQGLGSEGVHVIDPFVGTGTFITRLLQSGLIAPEDLKRKYENEIHANEIVLLAYYIAAINIETVFHAVAEQAEYAPFEGICLTDTFALHEGDDELSFYMKENTDRRERQKASDITVIIGNPPYSAGQKSENDNAKNVAYSRLDERIRSTYAAHSESHNVQNLYDSYIRAIRWGSDRMGEAGVMAYVSGSAWIERAFADGMRKCLLDEFQNIHVFHLRGDGRKNMLSGGRAGEGQNVFGQASMTGVAVSIFVKSPHAQGQSRLLFHDIGNDLDRESKLDIIKGFRSMSGIGRMQLITPDKHGDWLDQRNLGYESLNKLGDKEGSTNETIFENFSLGVATGRDAWCVNPSRNLLQENIGLTIGFFNSELARWIELQAEAQQYGQYLPEVDDFVRYHNEAISWSDGLKADVRRQKKLSIHDGEAVKTAYRPFAKQWHYLSQRLNARTYQIPQIFPNDELRNRVIAVTGKGGRAGFSCLMLDALPNLHTIDSGQCFPLWLYENTASDKQSLFNESGYRRRDAITDFALNYFRETYPSETIRKEDIFHYIYGLLHSEDYRSRYRANLQKELPRIACVKSVEDYRAFRDAGRRLGEIHVGYETVAPYPADIDTGGKSLTSMDAEQTYRVTKMKHAGSGQTKDLTTVIYNPHITIRNIPLEAYDYIVNGKPAIQWVMERQCVKTDKASGIVSDANRYAIETVGDPRYPLDLLLRIITVSLETMKIVRSLPQLDIHE